jgi:hypothetical protein
MMMSLVTKYALPTLINGTFLASYLKALENKSYIRSKKIEPAKGYFSNRGVAHAK